MKISVTYPCSTGGLILRTALNWDRNVSPVRVDGHCAWFDIDFAGANTLELKPCLLEGDKVTWSKGPNYVFSAHEPDPDIWPYFHGAETGRVSEVLHVTAEGVTHAVRIYFPPGYDENELRRFPVLYMQDGQNLFFPQEAFAGHEWQVDETMDRLDRMNSIRKTIVVGVAPADRMRDYTKPGYEAYGRFVVNTLKPLIDAKFRTRVGARDTAVMGSSLGGVTALYLAWTYPHIFGRVACLSSTFGFKDDLFARIATEPKRDILIYLDSGWPKDNYDTTNAMRDLLVSRGYQLGTELLQFSFPQGTHNEGSWAGRIHIPFQFFFGRSWATQRPR